MIIPHWSFLSLPTAFCHLPFAICLLPFAFYLLPFAFCLLPFAFYLLPSPYPPVNRTQMTQMQQIFTDYHPTYLTLAFRPGAGGIPATGAFALNLSDLSG
jgi:hypothetical protein